jgi:hypothetical protein
LTCLASYPARGGCIGWSVWPDHNNNLVTESTMSNEYYEQAKNFLASNGIIFSAYYNGTHCPPWENATGPDSFRPCWLARFIRDGKSFGVTFYGSIMDKRNGVRELHSYDVLACLTKYDPGTLEDFCNEYGYSVDGGSVVSAQMQIDSIKQVYGGVCKEWREVRDFFTDAELEQLSEIS